jgi:hypothetical protein
MTFDDWKSVPALLTQDGTHSIAARLLVEAHRLACEGQLRFALIQANTALEVALGEVYRARIDYARQKALVDKLQSFWQLPEHSKLVAVAAVLGISSTDDLDNAILAIDDRNRIVHDGDDACESAHERVNALIRVVARLLGDVPRKFPSSNVNNRNTVQPSEKWNQ